MAATEKQNAEKLTEGDKGDPDREKANKSKAPSSKQKDLSHVPCKFFKVGACTAGSSCPFSHVVPEPGHPKDVCAWFVKGNCKFAHKCALAHILPGQTMSMDRKNKKAAQLAANGGAPASGERSGGKMKSAKSKDGQQNRGGAMTGATAHGRSGLLSGSTAPTRSTSSRPPIAMPLKATISPCAPAPPLKDADFAAFVLSDDVDGPPAGTDGTLDKSYSSETDDEKHEKNTESSAEPSAEPGSPTKTRNSSPPTLPVSVPTAPRRPVLSADAADLGPIGSPPRGSLLAHSPLLKDGVPSTFHAQTSLLTETRNRLGSGAGIASSLGATHPPAWKKDPGPVPPEVVTSTLNVDAAVGVKITRADKARDRDGGGTDEDLEEFLPSSLTDLLTPSERSRRMSRTHSNSSRLANVGDTPSPHPSLQLSQNPTHHAHHRYSRSVPAPSLLGDVKSIWADCPTTNGLPGSPDMSSLDVGAVGSGTPASHKSTNGLLAPSSNLGGPSPTTTSLFGTTPFLEDPHSPSPSLLAPSNASAAFLPSLHHYYCKMNATATRVSSNANNGLGIVGLGGLSGLSRSPMPNTPLHTPAADEPRANSNIGAGLGESLSPSIRALQAHAPGQSLPQGLAAGYSRIHALPVAASPGSLGASAGGTALSPGQGQIPFGINAGSGLGPRQEWLSHHTHSHATEAFSHLSLTSHQEIAVPATAGPPSISALCRIPSTSSPLRTPQSAVQDRSWHPQGALSPLSRPVVTGDDDDLFSMDG